ncbi:MAG TPA: hypothetical protein PK867_20240, partial [Pirellulales bacterium]|nr:hypothetical protein [Pirellulales bacterium]
AKTGDERAGVEAIARQRERLKKMLATRMDRRLKARLDPSDVVQESMIVASQRLAYWSCRQLGVRLMGQYRPAAETEGGTCKT